ncbi:Palmitoyltransferase [Hexamita inflata]|uniref:Palmitoyltransferase n=1 Tax=Hexamita inflata TaxID=28002 RepID=A0ABP1GSA8_9EUKA
MEIGNIKIYAQGRFIRGVQYPKTIRSALLLSIPGILLIAPTSFVLAPIYLEYPVIIITILLLVAAMVIMSFTACVDPGIIPGRELQEYYLNKLESIITEKQKKLYAGRQITPPQTITKQVNSQINRSAVNMSTNTSVNQSTNESTITNIDKYIADDPKNLFKKARCYMIFDSTHSQDRSLSYSEKGFKFTAKYCATCRFYRPMRSSHSSKSNVCIQRYDHFCQWIGTDVALHNHGLFYLMLGSFLTYTLVNILCAFMCFIVSIVIPASCKVDKNTFTGTAYVCRVLASQNNFITVSKSLNFACLAISLVVIALSSYIAFSLYDLISYHKDLLTAGTLTKEDTGGNNMSATAFYSLGSVKQNMRLGLKGISAEKILHKFILENEKVLNMARSNQFINTFDSLGRIMKMNGIAGFDDQTVLKSNNPGPLQKRSKSMRFAVMGMDEDLEDQQPQKIDENMTFANIVTARDAFEFAFRRAREMITMSAEQFTDMKKKHPEKFAETGDRKELMLEKMCKKKENGEGKPQTVKPGGKPNIPNIPTGPQKQKQGAQNTTSTTQQQPIVRRKVNLAIAAGQVPGMI